MANSEKNCPSCFGTGKRSCRFCGGSGYNLSTLVVLGIPTLCAYCRGSGKETCSTCAGTGKLNIPKW